MADTTVTILGDSSSIPDGSQAAESAAPNDDALDAIVNGNGAFNYSTVGNYRKETDGSIYRVVYDRVNDKLLVTRVG